jgi:DNA-binding transcriptional ArsR family regulator
LADHRPGAVFAALADPTRRHLLERLGDAGPLTATALSRDLPMSRQAVAKHLGALAEAGLVRPERHGREVRFRLEPGPLDAAGAWLERVGRLWDRRLVALVKQASPTSEPSVTDRPRPPLNL